ncbi:MAG: DUF6383 domain-containing protein [Prevotellaceae bacterium]|nr:DUF6383 domain-containing protein [Prevotellaceae bacterium]MDY6131591.1 DUF6383 domain-containing protein [Prevotella sp.]
MKKKVYFASLMWMLSLTSAWAQHKPFAPQHSGEQYMNLRMQHQAKAAEEQVVVEENFNNFTEGTENEPDGKNIGGSSDNGYRIESGKMSTEGWTGNHVYQAGGVCALRKYESYGYPYYGHISTPETELYGIATITLRARKAVGSEQANLSIALCDNTSGVEEWKGFELTDEWQNITFTSEKGTFNDKNIFQLSAEKGEVLIDDIKVTRVRNKIGKPTANPAVNLSPSSFKASWQPVKGAEEYLLSVYYKDMPEEIVPAGTLVEGFDGINLKEDGNINTEDPNYPEGWTIDVSSNGKKDVLTNEGDKNSGKLAINMDAVGDVIVSAPTPAPIKRFSFWVKPSTMKVPDDYLQSLLGVYVKGMDGNWTHIANLPNSWMEEKGGMYSFKSDDIGDYIYQVKFDLVQKTNCTFAIDDVTLEYETQPVPYYVLENHAMKETSKVIENINPEKEYYYYVISKDGELLSDKSETVWVDGIVGLKPTVLPATDVTGDSFTARWEEMPHAGSYIVNLYEEVTTKEDGENVMLLHEDFEKITEGTVEKPAAPQFYTPQLSLAKEGMADTDWTSFYPIWAKGMIGGKEMNEWTGSAGLVVTPPLPLAEGNDLEVDFTAVTTDAEDELYVLIMGAPNATEAIMGFNVPFETSMEKINHQVVFESKYIREGLEKGKPYHVAFSSKTGKQFFIDEVKISQRYEKQGETVVLPRALVYPEGDNCKFENLQSGGVYLYDVQAFRMKNYEYYVSDHSDRMRVECTSTSIEDVDASTVKVAVKEGGIEVETAVDAHINIYDMTGRSVYAASVKKGNRDIALSSGIYVVKVNDETVKAVVR